MSESAEYGLIVSFPDQSESFTLGVEAGMFWQRVENGERGFSMTVHTSNLEVLRRMAAAKDLILDAWPAEVDGWAETELTEKPKPTFRIVSGGLSGTTP